jgi:cation:H+ antiporter
MFVAFIVFGLLLLLGGGDLLVRGAGRLALTLGVPPLVVGLTVVAFATSAPELAASLVAAATDHPELAVANVLGSNVANIGLIAASAAIVRAIPVKVVFLNREVPVLIVAALSTVLVLWDGSLTRVEGAGLLGTLLVYTVILIRMETRAQAADPAYAAAVTERWSGWTVGRDLLAVSGAVVLLVLGASLLVDGATDVAQLAGVSDRVIGLTIVAVGTSLPELAASLSASWRGQGDLALGNVVGSNIFNACGILGTSALVSPLAHGADAFLVDAWIVVGFSVLLAPLLRRGQTFSRSEGLLMLAGYAGFLVWVT